MKLRARFVLPLLLVAVGCDDSSTDADMMLTVADMGPDTDQGPEDDGARPDAAPMTSFDCELVCQSLANACPDALDLRGNCNSCADIQEGLGGDEHPETYARAGQICAEAQRSVDCRALSACVSDDHGLTAVAVAVEYSLSGTLGGEAIDIEGADAWAFVGAKKTGEPSDFELVIERADSYWLLTIDDLGVDPAAAASLADTPLTVRSTLGEFVFETGAVSADSFALDGAFEVSLDGTAEGDTARLTVSGAFR